MKLSALLNSLDYQVIQGTVDKDIEKLVYHSDEAGLGSLFFAAEGYNVDGKSYIRDAVSKGAGTVVTAGEPEHCCDNDRVTFIKVDDVRHAMAVISANFYENPSADMLIIGVTGTKGKTSTSFMIREILQRAGIKTGYRCCGEVPA